MRVALITLASGFSILILQVVSEAGATTHHGHAKKYVRHSSSYLTRLPRYQQTEGWYEHIADHLPIGSKIWWEQMEREGRGGFPRR